MAETYPCPVEGCDHAPFKTPQALGSHISIVAYRHNEKGQLWCSRQTSLGIVEGHSDILLAGIIFRAAQGADEMEAGYHVW
jgi:hypothetical protein